MSINNYTLGQLIYRIIQHNEAQTRRPEDNSIHFWKSFVNEFYSENAAYKYGMLVSSVGGGKHFEPLVLPARLLPRYYKAMYQDNMRSCACVLDNPQEYSPAVNTYILECSSARVMSVFDETQICTYGSLKVTFSANLKIENWVFDAHKHVEYVPHLSIEAKIASFMNSISTQLTATTNPNIPPNPTNKMNHTTTDTITIKQEENNSPTNGEKSKLTQPNFLDIECNGINSPSTELSLDNFLNDDEPTSTNSSTNNYSDNKPNIKELQQNIERNNGTNNGKSNIKTSNPGSDSADVLNLVRTQLQNNFKYKSPVNEYGITPQVMRCFEISDIFLSMEELMDYCLQSGCSPKSAMSLWVNAHAVYE